MCIRDSKLTMEKKQNELILHKTKTMQDAPHQQFEDIAKQQRKSFAVMPASSFQGFEELKSPSNVRSKNVSHYVPSGKKEEIAEISINLKNFGTIREETKESNVLFETQNDHESNIISDFNTRREEVPPVPVMDQELLTRK